jgi:hypothetical protein
LLETTGWSKGRGSCANRSCTQAKNLLDTQEHPVTGSWSPDPDGDLRPLVLQSAMQGHFFLSAGKNRRPWIMQNTIFDKQRAEAPIWRLAVADSAQFAPDMSAVEACSRDSIGSIDLLLCLVLSFAARWICLITSDWRGRLLLPVCSTAVALHEATPSHPRVDLNEADCWIMLSALRLLVLPRGSTHCLPPRPPVRCSVDALPPQ